MKPDKRQVASSKPAAPQPEPPALPAHALALHPWLARYAETARVEMLTIHNARTLRWERGRVVTVTV